ncbi:hypothetical protein GCM10009565_33780 [Amycolatopsis albidoflavus]
MSVRLTVGEDKPSRRSATGATGTDRVGNAAASGGLAGSGSPAPSVRDPVSGLEILRKDPALRQAELGRGIPPHCRDAVSGLARECARSWADFARRLEGRSQLTGSSAENSVD